MKNSFGVGDLIYNAEIYDNVNPSTGDDLEFYYDLAKRVEGTVLELCCGTGRLTIPLKKKGVDICGVDYTKSMLDHARIKANKEDLKLDLFLGDMKDLQLGNRKFDLIFIPFNSIQNTYILEDISKVFRSIERYLADDGIFAFDIFNPSIHFMVDGEKEYREFKRFTLSDGREVKIFEKGKYDSANQIYRVNWQHHIGGEIYDQKLDMRCFYPQEMDLIVRYNNFTIVDKFGDFKRSPFSSDSMKQVYVCRKSGIGI